MANVDYDNLSAKEKEELAKTYADQFDKAYGGNFDGTNETLAALLVKELRAIGSSDLVNKINQLYYNTHGDRKRTLRQATIREFSLGKETAMLNALGFADDKMLGEKIQDNPDKAKLVKEGRDKYASHFDIIGQETKVPYLDEEVKIGSGTQKAIKGAVQSKKQATPASPKGTTSLPEAPKGVMDVDPREAPMGVDAKGDPIVPTTKTAPTTPRGGLPQSVLNTIHGGKAPYQKDATDPFAPTTETKETTGKQLGPTRELAKTLKAATPATPAATGGSSGSGTGLDYLRTREERKQRDKAGKADIAEEQRAGRARAEERFSGMKGEILAQQAERARVAKEKSDANKIAFEGADGKEELLGRVIRDKSGKVIGHSTTAAGRRALGDPYKGVKGGAMDFDKPAESYAELDMRDAAKQRMGSKQQQVMDLWSKGASPEQRKQVAPLSEGLGISPDKIQPVEPLETKPLNVPTSKNIPTPSMATPPPPPIGAAAQQRTPPPQSTTSRLVQEEGERQQRERAIQADQFMDARGRAKAQAIGAAQLRDEVTGGTNYSTGGVTIGVEPFDSKLPDPSKSAVAKRLKELKKRQQQTK